MGLYKLCEHKGRNRDRCEIVRPYACEGAAVAADRRPHGREHDGAAHDAVRRGRRTSSPPQFGQTASSALVQPGQNVHS